MVHVVEGVEGDAAEWWDTEAGQQVPETRNPNLETRNPKPETRTPRIITRIPKPETRNRNPKPETRDPTPETRNPTPEIRNPKQVLGIKRVMVLQLEVQGYLAHKKQPPPRTLQ